MLDERSGSIEDDLEIEKKIHENLKLLMENADDPDLLNKDELQKLLEFSPLIDLSNPTVLASKSKDMGTNLDLDSPLDLIDNKGISNNKKSNQK